MGAKWYEDQCHPVLALLCLHDLSQSSHVTVPQHLHPQAKPCGGICGSAEQSGMSLGKLHPAGGAWRS